MTEPPYIPWPLTPPPRPVKVRNPLDSSTWGPACARGVEYAVTGAPVASGTKAVVRKISTGRKSYRGMASEGLERQGKL
jgi:hypothetical protein